MSLHGENTRVPLLIRLPQARGGGRRIDSLVGIVDLMPTLLALAGAEPPPGLQGRNLSAVIEEPGYELPGFPVFSSAVLGHPAQVSVEEDHWKVIWDRTGGKPRLYDLSADPEEQKDQAGADPGTQRRLARLISAHLQELASRPSLAETASGPTEEELNQLRGLGYIR